MDFFLQHVIVSPRLSWEALEDRHHDAALARMRALPGHGGHALGIRIIRRIDIPSPQSAPAIVLACRPEQPGRHYLCGSERHEH